MSEPPGAASPSLATYADATAQALGLPIAPEDRAAVLVQLEWLLAMGQLVAEFPLPEDVDPAPVFEA